MASRKWLITGVLTVVVVVVATFWFLFFRGDTPDPISTEASLQQLQEDLATIADGQDNTPSLASNDADPEVGAKLEPTAEPGVNSADDTGTSGALVNGTWMIDDDFGDFDFVTASGSFAGFRVEEELTVGAVTAVGRSGGVSGSLTIEDGTLVAAEVAVDMTTIQSNDHRRENAIRSAIGTRDFPTAMFVLTEPVPLDVETLEAGSTIIVPAVGDLTVKGITNQVAFLLQATIAEPGVGLIVGSTDIFWEDFDVIPPHAPIVVSVAEHGIIEFQLIVRPAS